MSGIKCEGWCGTVAVTNGKKWIPVVSVVTPSFNHGAYIEETINSVLDQGYPNMEYIVIDGGSTDNTIEILRKYEDKLKWISEKDNGPEDAINKGLAMSSGEVLAWLASDDTYLPGTINKVIDFFRTHREIDMVYGKSHYIDRYGNVIWDYPTEPYDYKKMAVYNIICQPSTFFKREAFFSSGELSLELQIASDYDLWLRMAQRYRIQYLPELMSNYRLHDEAKTMGFKNHLIRFEECLNITTKYYDWAPINRIYPYSYYLLKDRLPLSLRKCDPIVTFLALFHTVFEYLKRNRGIRFDDIKLIPRNLKKFFGAWELEDILKDRNK